MKASEQIQVEVVLVHAPVVNKIGETIGSAVTNLDLHDIARAGKTFGVETFWVVTPYEEQQNLVNQITSHWTAGHGGKVASDRAEALSIIKVSPDLESVIASSTQKNGRKPFILTSCAKALTNELHYEAVRDKIFDGEPVMLLFGTAWGLAPSVMEIADATLPPLKGGSSFNHLSVRSAVSIILDRLLSVDRY